MFTVEQGVDPAIEIDRAEDDATHVLARVDGAAAGTMRWRTLSESVRKFERVAVLSAFRGCGVGAALNLWAVAAARESPGVQMIRLNAQQTAVGFYQRLGFAAVGDPFVEAGLDHRSMTLEL